MNYVCSNFNLILFNIIKKTRYNDFQEKYLQEKIKVGGKTNNFGNSVVLERNKMKLSINSDVDFSKRWVISCFFMIRLIVKKKYRSL